MVKIFDKNLYDDNNICLSCEYDICSDCEIYNTNTNTNTNTNKESDIKDGESDTVQ